MANKAQQALQGLLDMESQAQASVVNSEKLLAARQSFDAPDRENDASLFSPEALSTMVGAAWLLGPAGGIAMGVLQGILGKQEKQAALDAFNERTGTLDQLKDTFDTSLERAVWEADTDENTQQILGIQAAGDEALSLLGSNDPELLKAGAQAWLQVQTMREEYLRSNEAEKIAKDVEQARIARELTTEQKRDYDGMMTRYEGETSVYDEANANINLAIEALNDGTPAQVSAAATLIAKSLDKEGVVRPEDEAKWKRLGNGMQKLKSLTEEYLGSGGTSVTAKNDMKNLLGMMQRSNISLYQTADARMMEEGIDKSLPPRFLDNFNRSGALPIADNTPLTESETRWLDEHMFKNEFKRIHGRDPREDEVNP